jgi:hypothetical protein
MLAPRFPASMSPRYGALILSLREVSRSEIPASVLAVRIMTPTCRFMAWRSWRSAAWEDCRLASSLTPRWSQRALPLEFMDDLVFILVFEFWKLAHNARGSALDR